MHRAADEHAKRLAVVYEEEGKLAGAMDKQDDAASALLAAPASFAALQAKLSLFRHHAASCELSRGCPFGLSRER
jgi:hypothetical protein